MLCSDDLVVLTFQAEVAHSQSPAVKKRMPSLLSFVEGNLFAGGMDIS